MDVYSTLYILNYDRGRLYRSSNRQVGRWVSEPNVADCDHILRKEQVCSKQSASRGKRARTSEDRTRFHHLSSFKENLLSCRTCQKHSDVWN